MNPVNLIQSLRNMENPLRSFSDLSLTGGFRAREMRHLMRIILFILRHRRELNITDLKNVHKLDNMSLAGIVKQISSEEIMQYLLDPLTGCLVLGEPDKTSASYGLALLKHLPAGIWTMKRGIGSIAGHLFEACCANIKVSTSVERVVVEDSTVKGVITDKGFMDADAVVCATTATRALAMIPDLPPGIRGPLEKVRYHACCHVVLAYPEKVLKNNCYSVVLPFRSKAAMAGFTDNAVKSRAYAPEGASLIQCFTYGRHAAELNGMPADEATRFVINDIRPFVPGIPDAPIFSEVYPWAEAMCSAPPGMLTAVQKMKQQSIDEVDGLYLAGDYLYMPSVEGALKSGIDAAERLYRKWE